MDNNNLSDQINKDKQLLDDQKYENDFAECEVLYKKIKSKSTQGALFLVDSFLTDYNKAQIWQVNNDHQAINLKRWILEIINYVTTDNAHSMLVAERRREP